ncbi:hypothetical protein [Citrobacter rodentium]|jgi:hypothetical protein|uniref:Uncharacterized protein n=2 Tax=Citrobacter rodentium TaxID=67825 RepID=D2TSR9_CITRI|nr:hypothetical protein [Citrobacter rodentium]QBY31145.1 hypothetical protein E2R62_21525 [Citrobacter rodentium]UHO31487.1 hypothetical protein K7R23_01710 [Citrobacter rodentium NBRC 105723 = DSM 16636]CBG91633.1 hypothetical protein ROD_49511 [Citrobacter rodentium ICC168]HAT8012357.1 hypothetical protein [Citrobacter rodentium NBRC 105723 = DSM 16636]HAT8017408.1 hypothetical protein [Citrobacter rodentium]
MSENTNAALGRALADIQFPVSEDKGDTTQVTVRLNNFNNVRLSAYCQLSGKSKNDVINLMIQIGVDTLLEKMKDEAPNSYNVFNNLCHEIGQA